MDIGLNMKLNEITTTIAKNLLMGRYCYKCMYSYKNDVGYCSYHPDDIEGRRLERDRLVPKENTCIDWMKRPQYER